VVHLDHMHVENMEWLGNMCGEQGSVIEPPNPNCSFPGFVLGFAALKARIDQGRARFGNKTPGRRINR